MYMLYMLSRFIFSELFQRLPYKKMVLWLKTGQKTGDKLDRSIIPDKGRFRDSRSYFSSSSVVVYSVFSHIHTFHYIYFHTKKCLRILKLISYNSPKNSDEGVAVVIFIPLW